MHTHKLFRPALAVSALALAASLSTPALAEAGDAAVAAADDSGTSSATTPATTTDDNTKIEWHGQIVVYGRGEKRIGEAAAASEGGVAGADIDIRPLLRPGELLEATPGLIATQHSGGGKANQYFLRGFNLDHGTDFALYVDDMPMNFRTHGHGQGYLDVNGLIPEVVARVDYRKGPYRASTGDFSFVGSSYITTRDQMEPFIAVEAGSYGYRRVVGGGSFKLGQGDLLVAGQAKFNDGPWELPEDYKGYSGLIKYSVPLGKGEFKILLQGFKATWQPTEQTPNRLIGTPLCADAYCSLDPYLNGRTEREMLTANYEDDDWKITAWAQHYDWSLLSNFTFYLDDPVNGDEIRQYEKMWGAGGRIQRTIKLGDTLSLQLGTELRQDWIDPVGLDHTIKGQFDYVKTLFKVNESSAGVYAEATWKPIDRLMVIGGMRGDFYRFDVTNLGGEVGWSGKVNDQMASPKIGVNYELFDGFAVYANWGQGFHSNDSRGVTNPDSPSPGLIKGTMKETGARLEKWGLILTGVYWWSSIDSELIYVGDSGAVEPSGPAKRHGYEITAFYKPNHWLAFDGVWTGSKARYTDLPAGENYVPGALESSGELGISALFPEWNAALRIRYLGPHALIEDNSQRGASATTVNLRTAWTPTHFHGFELYAELLNVLDSKGHDIDYYYATRFPGEPADGVEDLNSRIAEPRQLRIGLKKTF
ncbi:MAG: TonB-dependent receptor [Novosphingobium sp.]|nr:TonB-dependent receptor [Novosphingobium sp.]